MLVAIKRDGEMAYVDTRLSEWARWAKQGIDMLGYPRATMLARIIDQQITGAAQSGKPPVSMPDVIAEVDLAVCKLSHLMRKVIVAHYLIYASSDVKARSLDISRAHFWRLLGRAQRHVLEYLK